jgi:leucyl/phenylalanyl-tRNA--protein transferase
VPVYRLDHRLIFPPAEHAEDGLLAVGGDLRPERLLLAYSLGVFPWYSEGEPILWHSPDPRMVLETAELRLPRSLRKVIRRRPYALTLDSRFDAVIDACARVPRPGQDGTWITRDMGLAYRQLHRLGVAHSVEAWLGEALVGGAYGVSLGGIFFGESMFARAPDASKVAFAALAEQLARWRIGLVDCQVHTDHLARFGACEWPRSRYLSELRRAVAQPTRYGPWRLEPELLARYSAGGD